MKRQTGETGSNTNEGRTINAPRPARREKLTPSDEYTDDDLWTGLCRSAWRSMAKHGKAYPVYSELVFQQYYENRRDGNAAYDRGINELALVLDLQYETVVKAVEWLEANGWVKVKQDGKSATTIDVLKSPWHSVFGDVPLPVSKARRMKAAPPFDPFTGEILKREIKKLCGGMTKANVPCLQYVTDGDYCRHHQSQDPSPVVDGGSRVSGEGVTQKMVNPPALPFADNCGRGLDTQRYKRDTGVVLLSSFQENKSPHNAASETSKREEKLSKLRAKAAALGITEGEHVAMVKQ